MKTIPILVKTWAGAGTHRYRYIKRSIPSLLASGLPEGARVIIVDDQSTDPRLLDLVAQCARTDQLRLVRIHGIAARDAGALQGMANAAQQ